MVKERCNYCQALLIRDEAVINDEGLVFCDRECEKEFKRDVSCGEISEINGVYENDEVDI